MTDIAESPAIAFPVTDGFVIVVKRDCETCQTVVPVLSELASAVPLEVYTQDDATFPESPDPLDDTSLEFSWHHDIETVPTVIRVVGGVEEGKMKLGDDVTWRAKHLGINWTMTSKIAEIDRPNRFVDEQGRGPFRRFRHVHAFDADAAGTIMRDHIEFDAPLGPIGDLVERVILGSYLQKLIVERNEYLRDELEGRPGPAPAAP